MTPDERAFRAEIASGKFLAGVARGKWRLFSVVWPVAVIGMTARDATVFHFRFDCQNYPETPPTARPWDHQRNAPATPEHWPKGTGRVAAVFRPDWKGGSALYLPCDRLSIEGHGNWRSDYPSMIWNPDRGITQYLEIVHELLTSRDYLPPTVSPT
jgi:hypothetical protein